MGEILDVLPGDRAIAMPHRLRPPFAEPVDRLRRGTTLGRLVIRHRVDRWERGFQLGDRSGADVTRRPPTSAVADANVVRTDRRQPASGAVAEFDHAGERVDGVVPVGRAGIVEIRHLIPGDPVLCRDLARFADRKALPGKYWTLGGGDGLAGVTVAGAKGLSLDRGG